MVLGVSVVAEISSVVVRPEERLQPRYLWLSGTCLTPGSRRCWAANCPSGAPVS